MDEPKGIATSGLGYVTSIQDGLLLLVASALFVTCAVLLVQRLISTHHDDSGYMVKRLSGILCVVFTMVLLSRAGTGIATTFQDVDPIEKSNDITINITHYGDKSGINSVWEDGTTRTFDDLLSQQDNIDRDKRTTEQRTKIIQGAREHGH